MCFLRPAYKFKAGYEHHRTLIVQCACNTRQSTIERKIAIQMTSGRLFLDERCIVKVDMRRRTSPCTTMRRRDNEYFVHNKERKLTPTWSAFHCFWSMKLFLLAEWEAFAQGFPHFPFYSKLFTFPSIFQRTFKVSDFSETRSPHYLSKPKSLLTVTKNWWPRRYFEKTWKTSEYEEKKKRARSR